MELGFLQNDIEKVLLSALFGAIIGLEREWSGKSAGIRTMILVCLGSTLFTIVSFDMAILDHKHNSDVTRIASNIATGIGFIGGGLIFKSDKSIHGLTTASAVWASAAIGMAVGIGKYSTATVSVMVVWAVLVLMYYVELWLNKLIETREYHIRFSIGAGVYVPDYQQYFEDGLKLMESKLEKRNAVISVVWTIKGSRKKQDAGVKKMMEDKNVLEVLY